MLQTLLNTIPQRVLLEGPELQLCGLQTGRLHRCGFNDPAEIIGKSDF